MPGSANSDRAVVESEAMSKTLIKLLERVTGILSMMFAIRL